VAVIFSDTVNLMSYCNIPHNLLNSIHIDGVIMVMNTKIMQYHHDRIETGNYIFYKENVDYLGPLKLTLFSLQIMFPLISHIHEV